MTTRTELVLEAIGIEVVHRRGRRIWARCPFHESERASTFFVRVAGDRSGQNHCFSCKKGGGLTALVMHMRDCDRDAAVAFIAALGKGYEPPRVRARVVRGPPRMVRSRFVMPREVILEPLAEWVTLARRYAESRGITAEEVELFGLGYAVDGRLSGRIILPWLGAGRVLGGYSARTFVDEEPKYQTPPESDNADRAVMFGEHLWPNGRGRRIVVVTEGALNALAVRRAHDVAVAALGGSEIDPMQVTKLATFARVVLLTDPDEAGNKAALALERMLSRHVETMRVVLPEGCDALDVGTIALRGHLDHVIATP